MCAQVIQHILWAHTHVQYVMDIHVRFYDLVTSNRLDVHAEALILF